MSEIIRYVLVNRDDEYVGEELDTMQEARNAASLESEPHAIVQITYTFDDSELVWTPDGGNVWPPKPAHSSGNCEHCGQLVQWDDSIGGLITNDVDEYCPNGEQRHALPNGF